MVVTLPFKLPDFYHVERILTANGPRYRACGPDWQGTVQHNLRPAVDEAWDHHYVCHGAKPRLRMVGDNAKDVLSGLCVLTSDILAAGSYSGAFRLRAERMRAYSDLSLDENLWARMQRIANHYEEVAQRLEIRRVHD